MESKKENLLNDLLNQSQEEENGNENESEFKIWKKNAPYLYDVIITWGLDWPSLCVNWLQNTHGVKDSYYYQKMILGTHTSGKESDYLMIAKTRLPFSKKIFESFIKKGEVKLTKEDINKINEMTNEQMIDEYAKIENKIEIETKILHDGEVNKAKASPSENNIIATQSNSGDINIYNYHKYDIEPEDDKIQKPTKKLKYHTKLGYALSWSLFDTNYLLSGSYDGSVCLWDIESKNEEPFYVPIKTYKEHNSEVEDVCFSKKKQFVFGTCGDDKCIKIMDCREKSPVISVLGHDAEINSIDFNPQNEFLYITGSGDKSVALWDLRNPKLKLHSFIHHKGPILNVKWNNKRSNIFASSGEDNKILIWDLTQIGANIARDDNEEAPSEMIFEHGGHLDKINDIDWNPNEDMMCASVDDMNNLQIWEMNINSIINKD